MAATSTTPVEMIRLAKKLTDTQRRALKHIVNGTEPVLARMCDYGGYRLSERALQRRALVSYTPNGFVPTDLGTVVFAALAALP